MRILVSAKSHPGKIRTKNEDNLYVFGEIMEEERQGFFSSDMESNTEEGILFGVFDGMGGLHCGEYASYLTAKAAKKEAKTAAESQETAGAFLMRICEKSNALLCREMQMNVKKRMGSTLSILYMLQNQVFLCDVGDSPIFRLRNGQLLKISKEHTERELYEKLNAEKPKRKYHLTQNIGIFPEEMELEPYIAKGEMHAEDQYLLCTDGLTDMVSEEEISEILCMPERADSKAKQLMRRALENGGSDNITIVLIQLY